MPGTKRKKESQFLGLHARPNRWLKIVLMLIPFVLLIGAYMWGSHVRHKKNEHDKILPTGGQMVKAVKMMAFTKDKRTEKYLMWDDTLLSLKRMGLGLGMAALFALFVGLQLGLFPGRRSLFSAFLTFLSIIPPLAILPILFIVVGIGEFSKVVLIFIGTGFLMARDIQMCAKSIPREEIIKALTLGASHFAVAYRIVLPRIIPKLIDSLRIYLGPAWLFLIASEAIASSGGLGYRIFLVRRYLSMDVIIPYVLWITLLGFLMDLILRKTNKWVFPWYKPAENK